MKRLMKQRRIVVLLSAGLFAIASVVTSAQFGGPISSQSAYIVPARAAVQTTALITVGDAAGGYRMVGIPDGLGAFDNGDGTFTLLMNHELGSGVGITRAHGARGAFVSKWVINKSTLRAISGSDLVQRVYGWNTATQQSNATTSIVAFNRFCSGDLPEISAFFNKTTGRGTRERIYMHGEEGSTTGLQQATVVTGSAAGDSFVLGKFNLTTNGSGLTGVGAWENTLANPLPQDKTIVMGTSDGGTGIMTNAVAVYAGTKQTTGTEADKAGLTNGTLKFINVAGNPVEIVEQHDAGDQHRERHPVFAQRHVVHDVLAARRRCVESARSAASSTSSRPISETTSPTGRARRLDARGSGGSRSTTSPIRISVAPSIS